MSMRKIVIKPDIQRYKDYLLPVAHAFKSDSVHKIKLDRCLKSQEGL